MEGVVSNHGPYSSCDTAEYQSCFQGRRSQIAVGFRKLMRY